MRRVIGLIVLLVVLVLGLSFSLLNAHPVTVEYYLGKTDLPLSLALVIALFLGAVLGVLASLGIVVRQRRALSKLRKRVNDAERELSQLRTLPIKDSP